MARKFTLAVAAAGILTWLLGAGPAAAARHCHYRNVTRYWHGIPILVHQRGCVGRKASASWSARDHGRRRHHHHGTPPPVTNPTPPPSTGGETRLTAYTTGYGWWDNTPPGSSTISNPVIHQTAGGTGTYADPITLAVGHSIINGQDILDVPAGTRFYIPNLRRYFIVEDTCGDGPTPQNGPCHSLAQADPGAQIWLDLWVDGRTMSHAASDSCESDITANHLAVENPASNYAVVSGPIAGGACSQQYGDALVTSG